MAERRMLSSKIVCSDAFTEMPFSAQALYLQLVMEADDDGFLNRAKRIMGSIGATTDDLDLLIQKRYVLAFPNGVIVIKHWRMNNQIRKDRYTPTQYQDEFNMLEIKDDGAYTERLKEEAVDTLATTWQPDGNQFGNQMATQYRLVKDSLVKSNIEGVDFPASGEAEPPPSYQQIVDLYHKICTSFPKIRSLSEARKKAIKARLNTYTMEDLQKVFENAEASSFLKGSNDRNWSANFDWLIADKNIAKVLEGNYADKPRRYNGGRKEVVPGWCKAELGDEEAKAIRDFMNDETLTVANSPELADRAEKLKQRLGG